MEKSKNITSITTILLLAFGLLASSVLLAVTLLGSVAEARPASALLQEGLYAEEIEGDIDAAIKIYEQIISDESTQGSYAAKAMYRLGMCYLKKQNEREAKTVFEELVSRFPEETSLINKVRPLLDEMSNPDPAALMPPETQIYLELGSPGRQIERILNMLRGTPFENPLAAIGGGGGPGGKSPGDMLAALLNPSMMAEFKKIRGVALGFMCIPINVNNPPLVAVLYLGKSDALRGIILAALGMALQPGAPIEGMQTLRIDDTGGAAYDDNVIIIAAPLEQLTWCVKQYKGITQEPTLASQNKLFARLSRKSREDNALTIWLDGTATSAAIADQMTGGSEADELRFIDGIADLMSFEEVIASLSIRENGIGVEVKVGFKDGHQCLAYDLIRTPNLSRAGFEAVPAETIALVSLALGESESSRAKTTQKTIKRLTGLDIGREIFANIEQLTLFAVPPSPVSSEGDTAERVTPLSCFGLAVTSHNPQKTHRLLTQLFEVADLIANMSVNEQSGQPASPTAGRYHIWSDKKQKIYCYMDQAGSTTTLALSPEVVKASRSAQKSRQSALTAGPLKRALSELPPETSKLLLVNVGGAVRVADSYITWAFDNPRNPGHRLLAQLAQACDKTSVRLRTGEKVNSFALHVSVDGLPPLGAVLPLLMQLSQTDLEAKARATEPKPSDGAVVGAGTKVELIWEPGASSTAHKVYFGTNPDELSLLEEVTETSYDKLPAPEKNATYYWRIDEVQRDSSVIDGDVWSFSTGKLVGWWKFDEASGTKVADSSGNGYHGTVVEGEPVWDAEGKFGSCLNFDEKYGITIPKEV
ncbi:MAG: tetratricopeptide repeat protein, partial [Planctomycetota bacterium]